VKISVLNEGRRTMATRDTGAKHWTVKRGQRLAITENVAEDMAVITLNPNHQILDTWYYGETSLDEKPKLFIRVRVGRSDPKDAA
jgi:hypothetical protein